MNAAAMLQPMLQPMLKPELKPELKPVLTAPQTAIHGEGGAFHAALVRLRDYIAWRAKQLACGDADLADDLAQEATVHLWELDPSRFAEEDQLYLRRSLVNRMIDLARAERAKTERRLEFCELEPGLGETGYLTSTP